MSRPNILVILSDDQPYYTTGLKPDSSGAYWMPKLQANIGEGGLSFERAYVSVPLCGPSRVSLLTGRSLHSHGVRSNPHSAYWFRRKSYGRQSLGYYLSQYAGYDCLYAGKFLNTYQEVASWVPPGYSRWIATLEKTNPVRANVEGTVRRPRRTGGDFVWAKYETEWLTDKALQFISGATEPWFCVAAVSAPHHPYTPSELHSGDFDAVQMPVRPNFNHRDPNKPAFIRDNPEMNLATMQSEWRGKMEELMDVDDSVERLVGAVDTESTYIFYVSDNGFHLGEHRLHDKARPYEESVRTPLMVRGPGVRQDATTNLLTLNIDVSATIMDLAGLEPEDPAFQMDGRSLIGPMFEPDETQIEWRSHLMFEETGDKGGSKETNWHALRTEDYVYIEHNTGAKELYDMAVDPYQLNSIVHEVDEAELLALSMRLDTLRAAEGETMRAAEGGA